MVDRLRDGALYTEWVKFCTMRNKRNVESYTNRPDCIRAIKEHNCTNGKKQWAEWAQYVATYRITG